MAGEHFSYRRLSCGSGSSRLRARFSLPQLVDGHAPPTSSLASAVRANESVLPSAGIHPSGSAVTTLYCTNVGCTVAKPRKFPLDQLAAAVSVTDFDLDHSLAPAPLEAMTGIGEASPQAAWQDGRGCRAAVIGALQPRVRHPGGALHGAAFGQLFGDGHGFGFRQLAVPQGLP